MSILLTISAVLVVLYVLNKGALKNLVDFVRSQFGKLGRKAKEADPLADFQQRIDDAVASVKNAKLGMQKARGMISNVEDEVNKFTAEKTTLENRIKAALAANNQAQAEKWADELVTVETNLQNSELQLKNHREIYQNFVRQVNKQNEVIQQSKREAASLGVELKLSEVNRQFGELQNEFTLDNPLSDLNSVRENVRTKINQNNAVQQVNDDLVDKDSEAIENLERSARTKDVLARFKNVQNS